MEKFLYYLEKIFNFIVAVVVGSIIGILVRLFSFETSFGSITELFYIYLPWALGGSIILSLFAHFFPKTFSFIFWFIPSSEVS